MRFLRSQPWLRFVFPSSEMPREGPSLISDDVQYTADFFGGGYALREPRAWFTQKAVTKLADDTTPVIDGLPAGETVRIFHIGVQRNVVGPQVAALQCSILIKIDTPLFVPISSPYDQVIPVGASLNFQGHIELKYPTIVPGANRGDTDVELAVYFYGGDNIAYNFKFLSVSVPRGVNIGP
jgi:hypothetical protein